MVPNIVTGSYTGNAAAQNISLGFVPDYIRVVNITDGTISWEWFSGMAAASAFQTANHDTAQQSVISSNGITAYEGSDAGDTKGFTVGTALSTDTKVFRYVAMRSGPGGA